MTHILHLFLSVGWLSCSQKCVAVRYWYSAVSLSTFGPSFWTLSLCHILGGPQLTSLSFRRSAERRLRIRRWLQSWGTRRLYRNRLISDLKISLPAFLHFSTLTLNFLTVNNTLYYTFHITPYVFKLAVGGDFFFLILILTRQNLWASKSL